MSYPVCVSKQWERFEHTEITDDQFKALIFVSGLTYSGDAEIRMRLLSKWNSAEHQSFQDLMDLKHDLKMIQHRKC